jgi:orotate phosphoribosyltransferase
MEKKQHNAVEEIFRNAGGVKEGHFVLTSGLHSPIYWEKFAILTHPSIAQKLCQIISQHFGNLGIEIVAGPTTGGIILAFEVARQLGTHAIYAEKEGEQRLFRRGIKVNPGSRVLVVDDVLTTGKSIKETIEAIRRIECEPVGIGVLVDRSDGNLGFGIPLFSCFETVVPTFSPKSCPLCKAGIPITRPGSNQ